MITVKKAHMKKCAVMERPYIGENTGRILKEMELVVLVLNEGWDFEVGIFGIFIDTVSNTDNKWAREVVGIINTQHINRNWKKVRNSFQALSMQNYTLELINPSRNVRVWLKRTSDRTFSSYYKDS